MINRQRTRKGSRPAPDGIRYWLEILPAPGAELTKTYLLTLTLTEGAPQEMKGLFLPLVVR